MFAQKLKDLRAERQLTQNELSKKTGLSHGCIAMLEVGKRAPTGSTLIVLADALECSVDYLLGREDDFGNVTVQGTAPQFSAEEMEIVRIFKKLPADLQRRATAYMQNLVMLLQEEEQTKKERVIKK